MSFECKNIIDEYIKWIKDNTSIRSVEDGKSCGIVTPFMDRHNDHLEIYAVKTDKGLILTDDGYTISDLEMAGMSLNSPKRDKIFQSILNGFGVKVGENKDLYVEANAINVGQKKHYLLQAILAVNDMYTLSQENVFSLFKEDVEIFLKSNNLVFSKDIKLSGKTGFDHNIDFLIPSFGNKPERLIKTINHPKKEPVMATIFAFDDVAAVREQNTTNYVVYNDTLETTILQESISALNNYGIRPMPWSQKEKCLEEFALV